MAVNTFNFNHAVSIDPGNLATLIAAIVDKVFSGPITVNLNVNAPVDLKPLERLMSELSDKISSVDASLTAAIGRVQGDVATLNAQIADLQAKIAGGSATPADIAALDALRARIDGLDPTKPAVLPPVPVPAP